MFDVLGTGSVPAAMFREAMSLMGTNLTLITTPILTLNLALTVILTQNLTLILRLTLTLQLY